MGRRRASISPGQRRAAVARGGVIALRPIQAGQVFLVGDVVQIERQAQVAVELVARHQPQHRVAGLVGNEIVDLVDRRLALPAQRRAHLERGHGRHGIGGVDAQRGARNIRFDGFALVAVDRQAGDAGAGLPAPGQFARQVEFHALRLGIDAAINRLAADKARGFRRVVLAGLEHGARQVQAAVEQGGFQACLGGLAFDRIERGAGGVGLALRIEDLCVAGVGRQQTVDVVHHAHVRRGPAGGLGAAHAVRQAAAARTRVVGAGQQFPVVGQVEAGGQERRVAAVLVTAAVGGGVEQRQREAAVERRVAGQRIANAAAVQRLVGQFRFGPVVAEAEVVLASAQRELAVHRHVDQALRMVGGIFGWIGQQAVARGPVRFAVDVLQRGIGFLGQVVGGGQHAPALAQVVTQLGKGGVVGGVPARPVGSGVGAVAIMGGAAVRVEQWQRAPHHALAAARLVGVADGQRRVGAQLGVHHGVGNVALGFVAVQVRVAVLVHQHGAAGDGAAVVELAGDVAFHAARVPRAQRGAGAGRRLRGRPLADEIDGGRRVAVGRHQAVGAAHDVDALVQCRVEVALQIAENLGQADAVVLEVDDVESPRREIRAAGFHFFHRYARGGGQHVVDGGELEVVHLRAADHRDRLRGFAQVQVEAAGRLARARAVCVRRRPGDRDRGHDGLGLLIVRCRVTTSIFRCPCGAGAFDAPQSPPPGRPLLWLLDRGDGDGKIPAGSVAHVPGRLCRHRPPRPGARRCRGHRHHRAHHRPGAPPARGRQPDARHGGVACCRRCAGPLPAGRGRCAGHHGLGPSGTDRRPAVVGQSREQDRAGGGQLRHRPAGPVALSVCRRRAAGGPHARAGARPAGAAPGPVFPRPARHRQRAGLPQPARVCRWRGQGARPAGHQRHSHDAARSAQPRRRPPAHRRPEPRDGGARRPAVRRRPGGDPAPRPRARRAAAGRRRPRTRAAARREQGVRGRRGAGAACAHHARRPAHAQRGAGRGWRSQPAKRGCRPGLRGAPHAAGAARVPARRPAGQCAGAGRTVRTAAARRGVRGGVAAHQLAPRHQPAVSRRTVVGRWRDLPPIAGCHGYPHRCSGTARRARPPSAARLARGGRARAPDRTPGAAAAARSGQAGVAHLVPGAAGAPLADRRRHRGVHAYGAGLCADGAARVRSQYAAARGGRTAQCLEKHPQRRVVAVRDQEGGHCRNGAVALAPGGGARGRHAAPVHPRAAPVFSAGRRVARPAPGQPATGAGPVRPGRLRVGRRENRRCRVRRARSSVRAHLRGDGAGRRPLAPRRRRGPAAARRQRGPARAPARGGRRHRPAGRAAARPGRRPVYAAPHVASGRAGTGAARAADHRAGQAVGRDCRHVAGQRSATGVRHAHRNRQRVYAAKPGAPHRGGAKDAGLPRPPAAGGAHRARHACCGPGAAQRADAKARRAAGPLHRRTPGAAGGGAAGARDRPRNRRAGKPHPAPAAGRAGAGAAGARRQGQQRSLHRSAEHGPAVAADGGGQHRHRAHGGHAGRARKHAQAEPAADRRAGHGDRPVSRCAAGAGMARRARRHRRSRPHRGAAGAAHRGARRRGGRKPAGVSRHLAVPAAAQPQQRGQLPGAHAARGRGLRHGQPGAADGGRRQAHAADRRQPARRPVAPALRGRPRGRPGRLPGGRAATAPGGAARHRAAARLPCGRRRHPAWRRTAAAASVERRA
uniref:Uncharacterized protein n=1 Tax=Tanacetum cinerariifolium TaxID=118510 RepID=A0A699GLV5_TANCI|nr:hypothetical protein [Tanacetum cinerariifolium]